MAIIISLGGSLIVPDKIDAAFLKEFKKLIVQFTKKEKVALYCGGGRLARIYQETAKKLSGAGNSELDWIGIYATKLNAALIKSLFKGIAEEKIIENPTEKITFRKKVLVCCGWKPGWSTDYDAVLLAKNLKVKTIINMSNIEYVYDSDPNKNKNAKPIKEISWKNFRKIVGNKWTAGLNMPFDPIAAKEAERLGIKVIVLGKELGNLDNCLRGGD